MNIFRRKRMKYFNITLVLFLAILGTFFFLPPPQPSNAGCNPPDEECCPNVTTTCFANGTITGLIENASEYVCWNPDGPVTLFAAANGIDLCGTQEVVTINSDCSETTNYVPVCGAVSYEWEITGPDSTNGVGPDAHISTTNCGIYTATFYLDVDRDCPPSTFTLATNLYLVKPEIEMERYIGIDLSPFPKGTNSASGSVEVCPDIATNYSWLVAPNGVFNPEPEPTDTSVVVEEQGAPSSSYLEEVLAVTVSPSGCSVATNFTIVEVDISIQGKDEEDEIEKGGNIPSNHDDDNYVEQLYIQDMFEQGPISNENDLVMFTITLTPEDLPTNEFVTLAGVEHMYEDNEKATNAAAKYPVSRFPLTLYIDGQEGDESVKEHVFSATHDESGAKDEIKYTYIQAEVDLPFFGPKTSITNSIDPEIAEFSDDTWGTYLVLNDDDDTAGNVNWDFQDGTDIKTAEDSRILYLVDWNPRDPGDDYPAKLSIEWDQTDKVAVFRELEEGILEEIEAGDEFDVPGDPELVLCAEGKEVSDTMKDIVMTFTYTRDSVESVDKIKVSVVSVDIDGDSDNDNLIDEDDDDNPGKDDDEVENSEFFPVAVFYNDDDDDANDVFDNMDDIINGAADLDDMTDIYIREVLPQDIPKGVVTVSGMENVRLFRPEIDGEGYAVLTNNYDLWDELPITLKAEGVTEGQDTLIVKYEYFGNNDTNGEPFAVFDDKLIVEVFRVDIDVDSDHTANIDGGVERSDFEDAIESGDLSSGNLQHLSRKYIVVNDYYDDNSGVPGYADDQTVPGGPIDNGVFVPMKFEAYGCLNESNSVVRFNYTEGSFTEGTEEDETIYASGGRLRLWTKPQGILRDTNSVVFGGDFIPANTDIDLGKIGNGGEMELYIEGITPSDGGLGTELISVSVDGCSRSNGTAFAVDDIKCTIIKVDADIDSNNNDGFEAPSMNYAEDNYEDMEDDNSHPGKFICVNDNDDDGDRLPDFADGYNFFEAVYGIITNVDDHVSGERFTPIIFKIPEPIVLSNALVHLSGDYIDSDPLGVTTNEEGMYVLPEGDMRLWLFDGKEMRNGSNMADGGHIITQGIYTAEAFGFTNGVRTITRYLESVRPSSDVAKTRILFEVDPDGVVSDKQYPEFIAADAVRMTDIKVKLDADYDHSGVVGDVGDLNYDGEYDETGLVVPVSSSILGMMKQDILPDGLDVGEVELSVETTGTGSIKVWTTKNRQTESLILDSSDAGALNENWILNDSFHAVDIPDILYIEGITNSSAMGDVSLTLTFTYDDEIVVSRSQKLTVVDAELNADYDHSGVIGDAGDSNADGEYDETGLVVPVSTNIIGLVELAILPDDMDSGEVELSVEAKGEGDIKIWSTEDRQTESLLLDSSDEDLLDVSWVIGDDFSLDNIPGIIYIEGTNGSSYNGDISIYLTYTYDSVVVCEATQKVTVVEIDVDIDSDNDNGYNLPESNEEEDVIENLEPGKIVYVNSDDGDEDNVIDWADGFDGEIQSDERFVPIVFSFPQPLLYNSQIEFEYSASDPADVTLTGGDYELGGDSEQKIRIWMKDGNSGRTSSAVPGGDWLAPGTYEAYDLGLDSTNEIVAYVEAVRPSETNGDISVTMRAYFDYDNNTDDYAEDTIRITAVESCEILNVSESFTPHQYEAPPYHVMKIDFEDSLSHISCSNVYNQLEIKSASADWESPFYVKKIPDGQNGDTDFYVIEEKYDVSLLYIDENSVSRICWDGRKDADGDGEIDTDSSGNEIWANTTVDTNDVQYYDIRIVTLVEPYNGNDYTNVSNIAQTSTTPLPDFGCPENIALAHGAINTYDRSLFINGPSMSIKGDGRPLPEFYTYYSSKSWWNSSMGFGWRNNYDIRLLNIFDNGTLKQYFLDETGCLYGPADGTQIIVHGLKCTLAETDDKWTMTDPEETVYTFNDAGQLESIEDRNNNVVEVAMEPFDTGLLIERVSRIKTADDSINIAFTYSAADDTKLEKAALSSDGNTKEISFQYYDSTDVYETEYAADEMISGITSFEGMNYTLTVGNVYRTNQASRLFLGDTTAFSIGDNNYTVEYSPENDAETFYNESIVSNFIQNTKSFKCKEDNDTVQVQELGGDGYFWKEYVYSGDQLQQIAFKDNNNQVLDDPISFGYVDGRRINQSTPNGVITYGYNANGLHATTTYPDWSLITYAFGAKNQVSGITQGSHQISYELDADGNITKKTETGDDATDGDRVWNYTRKDDGSIDNCTSDPGGQSSSYTYDNDFGLVSGISRVGVNVLHTAHDAWGNVVSSWDANDNETKYEFDDLNRQKTITYPSTDTEEWTYTGFGKIDTHTAPQGCASSALVTTYSYDGNGKMTGYTEAGGGMDTITYAFEEYDDADNPIQIKVTQGDDEYTIYRTYDYMNQVVEEKIGTRLVFKKEFDQFGNVTKEVDGNTNTHSYAYYSDGSLHVYTRPDNFGSVTHNKDGVGNTISIVNDPGTFGSTITTTYTYDKFNRVRTKKNGRNAIWTYTYDQMDNMTNVEDPLTNDTVFEYNDKEQLTGGTLADTESFSCTSDNAGNMLTFTDCESKTWIQTYNNLNMRATSKSPLNHITTFGSDLYGYISESLGNRTYSKTRNAKAQTISTSAPGGAGATIAQGLPGVKEVTDSTGLKRKVNYEDTALVDDVTRGNITTDVTEDDNGNLTEVDLDKNAAPDTYIDRTRSTEVNALNMPVKEETGSGVIIERKFTGNGLLTEESSPYVGKIEYNYLDDGSLHTIEQNDQRTVTLTKDLCDNITDISMSGGRTIEQDFNPRNYVTQRTTALEGANRVENFTRDGNMRITKHTVGSHITDFTYDAEGKLLSIKDGDDVNSVGINREFTYNAFGEVLTDVNGLLSTTYTYTYNNGYTVTKAVQNGSSFSMVHDSEKRLTSATGGATYAYTYDSNKFLTKIEDSNGDTNITITLKPDASGYPWTRGYPEGITVKQEIDDANVLNQSVISGAGIQQATVSYTCNDKVHPNAVDRPGAVPDSTMTYNVHKEILSVIYGNSDYGVTLTRNADTGYVESMTREDLNKTTDFTHNKAGWITNETIQVTATEYDTREYEYRSDGVRESFTRNGRTAEFTTSGAGAVQGIENALVGDKILNGSLESAYTNAVFHYVGSNSWQFATIHDALTNIVAICGTNSFTQTQVIAIEELNQTSTLKIEPAVYDIYPTADNPLVIKGMPGEKITFDTYWLGIDGVDNIVLDGLYINATSSSLGLYVQSTTNTIVQNCVFNNGIRFQTAYDCKLVYCTFANADARLGFRGVDDIEIYNNIFIDTSADSFSARAPYSFTSDYNCYYPVIPTLASNDVHSINSDPMISSNKYYITSSSSPVIGAATNINLGATGGLASSPTDIAGVYRHASSPCMGAFEWAIEEIGPTRADSGGRITQRVVQGRTYNYSYTSQGQLASYTDVEDPRRSAVYTYDHADRRIAMTVGGGASGNAANPYAADYRFVYHGDDVVAEYVDKPGSLNDYSRIYWLMPDIDQRIGFIHIDNSGAKSLYYYITDHQGSVLQIVDEDGDVINQYDYDAFGLINWNNSYEGIENRYTFQGREYDSHAGHYYYRYRTYIPEYGSFTGPDMNLSNGILGEPNGVGNYLFCNSNPVDFRDPRGLMNQNSVSMNTGTFIDGEAYVSSYAQYKSSSTFSDPYFQQNDITVTPFVQKVIPGLWIAGPENVYEKVFDLSGNYMWQLYGTDYQIYSSEQAVFHGKFPSDLSLPKSSKFIDRAIYKSRRARELRLSDAEQYEREGGLYLIGHALVDVAAGELIGLGIAKYGSRVVTASEFTGANSWGRFRSAYVGKRLSTKSGSYFSFSTGYSYMKNSPLKYDIWRHAVAARPAVVSGFGTMQRTTTSRLLSSYSRSYGSGLVQLNAEFGWGLAGPLGPGSPLFYNTKAGWAGYLTGTAWTAHKAGGWMFSFENNE